jgi:hypothetical protein
MRAAAAIVGNVLVLLIWHLFPFACKCPGPIGDDRSATRPTKRHTSGQGGFYYAADSHLAQRSRPFDVSVRIGPSATKPPSHDAGPCAPINSLTDCLKATRGLALRRATCYLHPVGYGKLLCRHQPLEVTDTSLAIDRFAHSTTTAGVGLGLVKRIGIAATTVASIE